MNTGNTKRKYGRSQDTCREFNSTEKSSMLTCRVYLIHLPMECMNFWNDIILSAYVFLHIFLQGFELSKNELENWCCFTKSTDCCDNETGLNYHHFNIFKFRVNFSSNVFINERNKSNSFTLTLRNCTINLFSIFLCVSMILAYQCFMVLNRLHCFYKPCVLILWWPVPFYIVTTPLLNSDFPFLNSVHSPNRVATTPFLQSDHSAIKWWPLPCSFLFRLLAPCLVLSSQWMLLWDPWI